MMRAMIALTFLICSAPLARAQSPADATIPVTVQKPHTLTQQNVGTRYVLVAIRTLVDPNDPKDLDEVHKLQDAITVSQKEAGKLELPNWDQASLKEIRGALLVLARHISGFKHGFGTRDQVDPIMHLIGTAAGWGGNPDKDATYLGLAPAKNDGTTVSRISVKDVPVDAFWSVSVYNAAGYFEKNAYNAYSVNNITAKKLRWHCRHSVRRLRREDSELPADHAGLELHRATVSPARREILNGKWHFPEAQPVG